MRGDIQFKESLQERVKLLKGIDVEKIELIKERLILNLGVKELCICLRKMNIKSAIISGNIL